MMQWVGLQCVSVAFPGHNHILHGLIYSETISCFVLICCNAMKQTCVISRRIFKICSRNGSSQRSLGNWHGIMPQ